MRKISKPGDYFPLKSLPCLSIFSLKMANTYTQLHIQFVFAVKYQASLIQKEWKDKLHGYITGMSTKRPYRTPTSIRIYPTHEVFRWNTAETRFLQLLGPVTKGIELDERTAQDPVSLLPFFYI